VHGRCARRPSGYASNRPTPPPSLRRTSQPCGGTGRECLHKALDFNPLLFPLRTAETQSPTRVMYS